MIIDSYQGSYVVISALRVAPYLFVRPGELRQMRWLDIDLNAKTWTLTTSKTHNELTVPLATQVVDSAISK